MRREDGAFWDDVYLSRGDAAVSWYQETPRVSLDLIGALDLPRDAPIVDVGGGASTLVDGLARQGRTDVTVLDISSVALDAARARLDEPSKIRWVHSDVLAWRPDRRYALWHDRAVYHFLVAAADRRRYLTTLSTALGTDGAVVIGVFAPDAPDRCSGLPVARYSAEGVASALGAEFAVVESRREVHMTPGGKPQPFTWVAARRNPGRAAPR